MNFMKRLLIYTLSVFIIQQLTAANAYGKHYLYKQILLNTGLPTTLNCISSDTQGFVWTGTKSGLGRFDGHEQKRYLHQPGDSTSLPGNYIYQILEDSAQHLWILTDMGVARYNYRNNNFLSLKTPDGKPCIAYSICQWEHQLLLGGANKVYSYDLHSGKLSVLYELKHRKRFEVIRMAVSQGKRLLCCSRWEGIYAIDLKTGRVSEAPFKCGKEISDMFIDSQQRIWISPYNQGVRCFAPNGKKIAEYTTQNSELTHDIVLCIIEKEGQIWFGTDGGGINILNPETCSFSHLKHVPGDKLYSLPTNSINCLYRDLYQNIWIGGVYNGLISKGIDAYWMDSTEPDYLNWKESDLNYVSGEGRTWRSLRNAFPIAHVGGVSTHHRDLEAKSDPYLTGKRVSILTRSAFAGQQRYGANTWSGDVTASWQNFAAQIPAACNLSVCGIPYWNSDIGGFFTGGYGGVNDPNWRQLYMRWMQFGTFTPMMRFHGTNTPREIWQFGSADDGLGDYDQILKYVKMRYRMLPYLYSTAWQVYKNDATFMRALAIAFNGDPQGYDVKDEYMFGDAFLVAPVVQEAAPGRNVYLPEGTKWVDFWTGETLNGGQTVNKQANVDIIPLYVRAGSILPWGPDVQYSTEKPWDDLEIRIYPGADGSFTLYEDENDGYGYEDGAYTEIPFTWDDDTQTLTIGARNGQFDGMLESRTFRIVKVSTRRGTGDLHTTQYEAVVTYDGSEIQIVLDSKDQEISLTDITADYIQNPSFEENNGSTDGWTVNCNTTNWGVNPSGGTGNPLATDGNHLFYVWDNSTGRDADISQQITLPAGTYRLTVDMHAPDRTNEKRVGNQRLYVDDAIAYFKDQVPSAGMTDNYPLQTISLDFTVAADNTPVTIGVTTSDAPAETWYKIDNFRLYAVSRPVLELDEEKDYTNEQEGMTDVHILRSLKADTWNTFCVPFSLDEAQAEAVFNEVKALSSVEKNGESYTLNFTDAASIEAGTPYLVKPTAATTELTLQDVAVTNTETTSAMVDGVSLIGTYSPMTIANGEFFISDNAFYLADVSVPMKGYRAYIKLDENPDNRVNRLLIAIDGTVTGTGEVLDAKADGDKPVDVYTVGGLRVKAGVRKADALRGLPKGVYVVDGEKYVK